MKWYPWLNTTYQQILYRYQKANGHHALLLHSQPGNGEISLLYALSRWLICRQSNGVNKSCGLCKDCRLMIAGNHPDFYQLEPEKIHKNLGVDYIRSIIESIHHNAHQGGVKVILLPNTELLTDQSPNVLLKALEEPPTDTYFLLGCHTLSRLLPTLRSRCLYWSLSTPNEEIGLRWLKKAGFEDSLSAYTALRICANAPLLAEALLQPACWQKRTSLCEALQEAHISGNFLILLPILNRDKDYEPLHWLLSLISDALKWQKSAKISLVNIDKVELVAIIANRWPARTLHMQWRNCLKCLCQCQEISGINRELLLIHYLLNWERGISDSYLSL
ncbi:DNA polymerase III subunit delta' [Candidatus Gullanella endobia]|uniref:DNA polymerase III subunit delta' n=1 Tax=Candidatus Gullanella endobia TaxID=1070130 RepID=A0A143WRG1_9ENTR|nr:DNA polymerase III subunit delta' C-terminal domain-containing protein [Candidatus Gullanella endobia]CUX96308.1 DNA polymerase III subunit delta' [Candidatus Gullanella endobia]